VPRTEHGTFDDIRPILSAGHSHLGSIGYFDGHPSSHGGCISHMHERGLMGSKDGIPKTVLQRMIPPYP
jgi:hypothetical protein